jgi:hypothetical protein
MDKHAPLIETALQDEAMKVWVSSQELAAGLVGKDYSVFRR